MVAAPELVATEDDLERQGCMIVIEAEATHSIDDQQFGGDQNLHEVRPAIRRKCSFQAPDRVNDRQKGRRCRSSTDTLPRRLPSGFADVEHILEVDVGAFSHEGTANNSAMRIRV